MTLLFCYFQTDMQVSLLCREVQTLKTSFVSKLI